MVKFYALSLQACLFMCLEDIKYFNSIPEKENYTEKVKFLNGLKVMLTMFLYLTLEEIEKQ